MYRNLESALDRESERTRRETKLLIEKEKAGDSDEIIILDTESDADKKKNEVDAEKKKTEKKEEKKIDPRQNFKALVNDVDAFAAFAHFDENICGFIIFFKYYILNLNFLVI